MPEELAPSIALLELLAACSGMPEELTPSIGLLDLLAPCSGMPEEHSSGIFSHYWCVHARKITSMKM
jgi:hypothetical protein